MNSLNAGVIIGGGLDGLILSHCLKKEGLNTLIFEVKSKAHNDAKTPLILWPKAVGVLSEILPLSEVKYHSLLLQGINYYNFDGRPIASCKFPDAAKFLAFERNQLAEFLKTDCEVIYEKRFERFGDTPEIVKAYFDDGTSTTGRFLVGCDGVNSRVRKQIQRESDLYYNGFNQWMGVVENSGLSVSPEIHIYSSFGVHFGMVPLHQNSIGWWVQIRDSDENEEKITERAEKIYDFVGHWAEPVSYLVQNAISIAKVKGFDRPVTKGWHWGNGGLVGHAAHPMLPYLNLGLNQAIGECFALSKLLAAEHEPSRAFIALEKSKFRQAVSTRRKINRNINRLLADSLLSIFQRNIAIKAKAALGRV